MAGHHQRIARLLRPVQHAHLHRAADADAPRAARQLCHSGLPRRAEHVADLQPRGQIKFLAHQRLLLAQRRRPAEGDALHPGSKRVRVACRVGHERLTGRFKRFDLKIEQRAQGHAAARRRPLRLLHGDARVHPHIRLKLRRVDAVLKVARRLHRADSRQIPLRIQRLKAHVPAQRHAARRRPRVLQIGLRLHAEHRHRVAHAPRQRRLALYAHLFLSGQSEALKAKRLAG